MSDRGGQRFAMLTEREVNDAYLDVLFRGVDPSGLSHFSGRDLSIDELTRQLRASPEYRTHIAPLMEKIASTPRPRVLLFGAYGNGNLGDDIQASAVTDLMETAVPGVTCWSTSLFLGDYPGRPEFKIKPGAIYSRSLLRRFHMLVIGGGGLLAHPHHPLNDLEWVERLPMPIVLLGIGAHGSSVNQTVPLLRKAEFVGCRDANSLQWVSAHTARTGLVLDPVLISPMMRPKPEVQRRKRFDRCWIVRDPIDSIVRNVASKVGENDIVVGIEPRQDQPLAELFPKMTFVSDLEQLWDIIGASRTVVSMRYHGVILGLRAKVPSYALRVDKARFLLTLLGLRHLIIEDLDEFRAGRMHVDIEAQIAEFRSIYADHFRSLLYAARAGASRPSLS